MAREDLEADIHLLRVFQDTEGWQYLRDNLIAHLNKVREWEHTYALKGDEPIRTAKLAQETKDLLLFVNYPQQLIHELEQKITEEEKPNATGAGHPGQSGTDAPIY